MYSMFILASAAISSMTTTLQGVVIGIGVCIAAVGGIMVIEGFQEESAPAKTKGFKTLGVGIGVAALGGATIPLIMGAFPAI